MGNFTKERTVSEARKFEQASASQAGSTKERERAQRNGHHAGHEHQGAGPDGQGEAQPLSKIGQEAVSQAQEQAVKIVSQAKQQVSESVASQTTRASRIAGVLSSSLHDAGTQLREQDEPMAARYVDQAADQVEQVAAMLDEQDIVELLRSVQQFAKRQPVLFFASAVVVGAIGARFLRSSSPQGASSGQGSDSRDRLPAPDAYAGLHTTARGEAMRAGG